jgi:hypothetical protein
LSARSHSARGRTTTSDVDSEAITISQTKDAVSTRTPTVDTMD